MQGKTKQPQGTLRLLGGEFVIFETSALARETLKLFYSAMRLLRLLAGKNVLLKKNLISFNIYECY